MQAVINYAKSQRYKLNQELPAAKKIKQLEKKIEELQQEIDNDFYSRLRNI